jgi:WD40 repeat protein
MVDTVSESKRFDAFISYSRDDAEFAESLEKKLERYRLPKGIRTRRKLEIFRDIPDLVGPTLPEAIQGALRRSEHLIVLCSPRAVDSAWVDREIELFVSESSPEKVIPVLLDGDPNADAAVDDKNWPFPAAVTSRLADPLCADFRSIEGEPATRRRARHREALFFVLARLLGVEKEDLVRRQRRRAMRLMGALVAVLSLLTAAFAAISFEAIRQRNTARDQARIATSRQLAAQSLTHLDEQFDLALLLALHAHAVDPNVDTLGSLLAGLERNPNLIGFLTGHDGPVLDLAFDASGSRLASLDESTIRVWDVRERREVGLHDHAGRIRGVRFMPDGERVIVVGSSAVEIRSADLFELDRSIPYGHPERVGGVAISRNGDRLAVAGRFHVSLWDLSEGRPFGPPIRTSSHSDSLAFDPDGKLLAFADLSSKLIRVLEVETQRQLEPFVGVTASSLAFSRDGQTLASGVRMIDLWDVKTRQRLGPPLFGHRLDVSGLAFGAGDEHLASLGADGTLRFWSLGQWRQLGEPLRGFGKYVLAVSPDGRLMATGRENGAISLWSIERWGVDVEHRLARRVDDALPVESVAFTPDGSRLVAGGEDGRLSLWDANTQEIVVPLAPALELETGGDDITKQLFDPTGEVLALAHFGFVTLWDFVAGEPRARLQHGDGMGHVAAMAFSPDGQLLVTGWVDGALRVWDVDTGQPTRAPLHDHEKGITSVAFSTDGRLLASADADGNVHLWQVDSWTRLQSEIRATDRSGLQLFIPEDDRLMAVGRRAVYRWNLPNLEASDPVLLDPDQPPVSVALSPDGHRLALLRSNGSIQLWQTDTEQPLGSLLPQSDVASMGVPAWGSLSFSPDGKRLASRSLSGTMRIWDVDEARWQGEACRIAGRNLSQLEWERLVGTTRAYCRVCPALPAGVGEQADAPECGDRH